MVFPDPTDEPPSFWATRIGATWGAPARDAALAGSRLPWSGAAVAPPARLSDVQPTHAPGPRPTLGRFPWCHRRSAPASNPTGPGAPAFPTSKLRWTFTCWDRDLVSLAAAWGRDVGWDPGNTAQEYGEGSTPGEKLWWKGASGPIWPKTRQINDLHLHSLLHWTVLRPVVHVVPEYQLWFWWWYDQLVMHNLVFAIPPSSFHFHSSFILAVLELHSKQRVAMRCCPHSVFWGIQTKVVIKYDRHWILDMDIGFHELENKRVELHDNKM